MSPTASRLSIDEVTHVLGHGILPHGSQGLSILQKGIVPWPHPFRPPQLPPGQRRDRVRSRGLPHTPHRRYIGYRAFMEEVNYVPQTHSPDGIEPEGDSVLRSLVYVGSTWPSGAPWSPRISLPLYAGKCVEDSSRAQRHRGRLVD